MKKIFILFIISFGCTSINKSHLNSPLNINVKSDLKAIIEVDTSKKLIGYASGVYLLHFFKISGDDRYADGLNYNENNPSFLEQFLGLTHQVKSAAAYNAIRTSRADVIMAPQYVIETNHWNPLYKQVKVKVTGFPGKIVSIKNK
jgi:hypothetical protein